MMRRRICCCCSAVLWFGIPLASLWPAGLYAASPSLADEVLALTGNAKAKVVWVRTQIFDDHGQKLPGLPWEQFLLYSESDQSQLVAWSTDEQQERLLDADTAQHRFPKIVRDGTRVLWTDSAKQCSWIIDWEGKEPKQKLIEGGSYWVLALQWDAKTKTEWVYAWDPIRHLKGLRREPVEGNDKVVRYPLRGLTIDKAKEEVVWDKTQINFALSVSADGTRMASMFPWPKVGIADLTQGTWDLRQGENGWGCHANVAPDDSGRFFHMVGNHKELWAFGPDGKSKSKVVLNKSMPGNDGKYDCAYPRWSNDARFLICSYPLGGIGKEGVPPGRMCLGKWNHDFTAVEKWIQVTPGDNRYRDAVGDAWIASGEGPNQTK